MRNQSVLVAWESKHGSTAEISLAIAGVLRHRGLQVTLAEAGQTSSLDGDFDAYVIGSAIYAGHWMKHAKQFVHLHRERLLARPVWLFSSGPIGNPPKPADPPVDIAEVFECTAPREHKIFAGRLDRTHLSFTERAITAALRAPEGDFRDWEEIRVWAESIAAALIPATVE